MTSLWRCRARVLVCVPILVGALLETFTNAIPVSYGRAFFLPSLLPEHCPLTLEVLPVWADLDNVTVNVTVLPTNLAASSAYVIPAYSSLNLSYPDLLHTLGVSGESGLQISSTSDVTIYVRQPVGDAMLLFPLASLDRDYVIGGVPAALPWTCGQVIVYATDDVTTVTVVTSQNDIMANTTGVQTFELNAFQVVTLDSTDTVSMAIRGDKPIGVVMQLLPQESSAANGTSCNGSQLLSVDMVAPFKSWGKQFYSTFSWGQGQASLSVTASANCFLLLKTDALMDYRNLTANQTTEVTFDNTTQVALSATCPVQVYVVGSMRNGAGENVTVGYFLPPLEQYLRCEYAQEGELCRETCPSFWPGGWEPRFPETSVAFTFPDANGQGSGEVNVVRETFGNVTFDDVAVESVLSNTSFLYFLMDTSAGSVLPAGTRLTGIYSACVHYIVADGGLGDGIDNDCDGRVDEELVNMVDDDNDSMIDEDTAFVCGQNESSRAARSGDSVSSIQDGTNSASDDYVDEDDKTRPLIAVIVSLCVALFAVLAIISLFLFLELLKRRNQLRNTKIRPFVS